VLFASPFFANVAQLRRMVGGIFIVKGRNVQRYGPFDLLGQNYHAVSERHSPITQEWGATLHKNGELLELLKRKENI
jgi:hypothetical protein